MSISVITPIFNGASLIRQFVDCMIGQTTLPDAVLFVNDGSTDKTDIELLEANNRLQNVGVTCKVVKHASNKGRGAARQAAIEAIDTRYVTWLDIDDLYGPERIRRLRQALQKLKIRQSDDFWILSTPYTICQASRVHDRKSLPGRDIRSLAELYHAVQGPRTLQLQSLAGPVESFRRIGFDPKLNWAEDLDFSLRFLGGGGKFVTFEGPASNDVFYFQSFESTSRAEVENANLEVLKKNNQILNGAGVNSEDEFQRKWISYISKFSAVPRRDKILHRSQVVSGALKVAEASETVTRSLLTLPETKHGVRIKNTPGSTLKGEWLNSEGEAISSRTWLPDEDNQVTWLELLAAYTQGADRLRVRSSMQDKSGATEFEIVRSPAGVFELAFKTPLQKIYTQGKTDPSFEWRDDGLFPGRFVPAFSSLTDQITPIYISFFSGAKYYKECAKRLSQHFLALGLDHQIYEFVPDSEVDWARLCRKKISYYTAQYLRHDRPIFWVDVDSRILANPNHFLGDGVDFGAFLRNFSYLPTFDPIKFSRLFHPGYIFLGRTDRTERFVRHLRDVDVEAPENSTDDYVLQESLASFPEALSFQLFSPEAIGTRSSSEFREGAVVFQHSDSGHVTDASRVVEQHQARILEPQRQLLVLREAAQAAMRRSELRDAAVFYKRIRQIMPDDADALVRLLGLYARLGEPKKFRYHFDAAKKNPKLRIPALRAELDRRYVAGEFSAVASIAEELLVTGGPDDIAFVKGREYRYSFDQEAAELGYTEADRVPMMWWEQPFPGNLGDIIGPYIVQALTGVPPRYTKVSPRMVSVGSIIKFARQGDTVWGSGAAAASQKIEPGCKFRAVRGPLTRRLVLEAGAECPEVFGDPAWLLPRIYPCSNTPKTHRLGLIRHFSHATKNLELGSGVREIEILRGSRGEIEEFLDEMNSCEAIISTSLHGVIIANAYGIPACWAVDTGADGQIHGDGMKFTDYAMSVGIKNFTPFDLASIEIIDASLAKHCTHNPTRSIDCRTLLEHAPFHVRNHYLDYGE